MMAQYLEVKAGTDCLLFYRMGDFYEMFFGDAVAAAAALDITLTRRGSIGDSDIPMCGVPFHAAETYLSRLIRKGFRVAICEQAESPAEAKNEAIKAHSSVLLSASLRLGLWSKMIFCRRGKTTFSLPSALPVVPRRWLGLISAPVPFLLNRLLLTG